jgi:hypothetical protein
MKAAEDCYYCLEGLLRQAAGLDRLEGEGNRRRALAP